MIDWKPIETLPFGERVMLFFEVGERGNGELAFNIVFKSDSDGPWIYWSWGGINSGMYYDRITDERPVLWADPEPLVAEAIKAFEAMSPASAQDRSKLLEFPSRLR